MKHTPVLGLAIAVIISSNASAAEQFQYGLRAGVSYSDNVNRTEIDEESSGAAAVGFDVRLLRETGRLQYNVLGDVEYRDYFESGVDSQAFGRLIADSSYAFVPDTFDWMLSGSFDQVREDILRPAAPDNLEEVISLTTGPRVTGRIGDSFEVQGEAHYTLADYSERPFDSETVGGRVAFGRRLSERTFLGIGGSYDDVTYDSDDVNAIAPDFERREYFLRFTTRGSRTTLDADVGFAEVESEAFEDDGPMAHIRLTRELTPYISGFVGYTREFPTSAEPAFAPVEGAVGGDSSVLTPGPRENESFELGLSMDRPRTAGRLMIARRSEDALAVGAADRDVNDVFASVSRLITNRSTLSVFGSYSKESIDVVGFGDTDADESTFGVQLNLMFGRALGVDLITQYRKRDSDQPLASFEELSGGIFVRYGTARRLGQIGVGVP